MDELVALSGLPHDPIDAGMILNNKLHSGTMTRRSMEGQRSALSR
jgi:hypothetical protein